MSLQGGIVQNTVAFSWKVRKTIFLLVLSVMSKCRTLPEGLKWMWNLDKLEYQDKKISAWCVVERKDPRSVPSLMIQGGSCEGSRPSRLLLIVVHMQKETSWGWIVLRFILCAFLLSHNLVMKKIKSNGSSETQPVGRVWGSEVRNRLKHLPLLSALTHTHLLWQKKKTHKYRYPHWTVVWTPLTGS